MAKQIEVSKPRELRAADAEEIAQNTEAVSNFIRTQNDSIQELDVLSSMLDTALERSTVYNNKKSVVVKKMTKLMANL